jgi:hypothetical protein
MNAVLLTRRADSGALLATPINGGIFVLQIRTPLYVVNNMRPSHPCCPAPRYNPPSKRFGRNELRSHVWTWKVPKL